ncbi:unnamed protein product [Amoebophrya sp. A120]|nr:unnamed protein product [Amoebophrya sp. A120]|eukprot:GSA120T00021548001.1
MATSAPRVTGKMAGLDYEPGDRVRVVGCFVEKSDSKVVLETHDGVKYAVDADSSDMEGLSESSVIEAIITIGEDGGAAKGENLTKLGERDDIDLLRLHKVTEMTHDKKKFPEFDKIF